MNKQCTLALKILDRLADALLLTLFLAGVFLVVVPAPVQLQEIDSVIPARGYPGSELILTVFGVSFDSGSSVRIPEGVITHYTRYINPEKLLVGISITEDAPPGPRPVQVVVSELSVTTLEQGFMVIYPEHEPGIDQPDTDEPQPEPEGRPDWALVELKWEIVEEGRLLVIRAVVANVGDGPAPEVIVLAESQVIDWVAKAIVPGLDISTMVEVLLNLEIPDGVGERHGFEVFVDPTNEIAEQREDNNRKTIEVIWEPPPEPNLIPLILTVVIVVVIVLGGITLTIRHGIKIRRRKEWQEKSKEEKPPEKCQPCTYYCHKIELELELALRKIAHLSLSGYDPVSGKGSNEKKIKGEIVDSLNRMVTARRLREKPEELHEQVTPLAHALLQQTVEWLHDKPSPCDLTVTGHLEGGKVTCQFILHHCKLRGTENIWEEEDKWKRSIKDERDEPVGTLRGLDPIEPGMQERVAPELTQQLIQFIKKV